MFVSLEGGQGLFFCRPPCSCTPAERVPGTQVASPHVAEAAEERVGSKDSHVPSGQDHKRTCIFLEGAGRPWLAGHAPRGAVWACLCGKLGVSAAAVIYVVPARVPVAGSTQLRK